MGKHKSRKDCVCGHSKGSHTASARYRNKVIVKYEIMKCKVPKCDCKKYKWREENEKGK